jgi:tRNA (uracil-5-)-methyltransferase TRM9
MIESACVRYPDSSFRVLDMRDIDALDEPFDLVFFIASLHHLESREDRLRTLSATKAVLAPDGLIGMTNWNLQHPKALRKYVPLVSGGRDYLIPLDGFPRYYRAFDPAELAELFAETDYHTIRNETGERNIVSLV